MSIRFRQGDPDVRVSCDALGCRATATAELDLLTACHYETTPGWWEEEDGLFALCPEHAEAGHKRDLALRELVRD